MKYFNLLLTILFFTFFACTNEEEISAQSTIAGITAENYPRVDGSTSTEPLNYIIACKLLGYRYEWRQYLAGNGIWQIVPKREDIPENFFGERIKTSQTHNAIINLIDNQADIIISARKMSTDERTYAQNAGVSLIETPVAWDALDFLLNRNNPITSLTVRQIQDIYLGNITSWSEVGGANEEIKPFIRNANSGSQEMMKEIVMDNTGIPEWDTAYAEEDRISTMIMVYSQLGEYPNAICFTPHYYREYIVRDDAAGAQNVKTLAVNGITPDQNSIANKTYPFVAPVYVSIRSDLDRNSMAYKMYEWLQTQAGKEAIAESGYIPTGTSDVGVKSVSNPDVRVYPNPVADGFYIDGFAHPAQVQLIDISGRLALSRQVANNEFISVNSLQTGVYVAVLLLGEGRKHIKIMKK